MNFLDKMIRFRSSSFQALILSSIIIELALSISLSKNAESVLSLIAVVPQFFDSVKNRKQNRLEELLACVIVDQFLDRFEKQLDEDKFSCRIAFVDRFKGVGR